jgi:hypothetical protein
MNVKLGKITFCPRWRPNAASGLSLKLSHVLPEVCNPAAGEDLFERLANVF